AFVWAPACQAQMGAYHARSLAHLSTCFSGRLCGASAGYGAATDGRLSAATTRHVGVAPACRAPPVQCPGCSSGAPASQRRAILETPLGPGRVRFGRCTGARPEGPVCPLWTAPL